jgi:type VI secretion system secreted protein Hcp
LSLGIFFSIFIVAISNQPASAKISGDTSVSVIATSLYLKLEVQGSVVDGGTTRAGYEDWITLMSFSHSVHTPYDAATGMATGARRHSPLRVTKTIDQATPLLYNAWAQNQVCTYFELRLLGPHSSGVETHYYTIELEDARIVSIQTSASTAPTSNVAVETVSFVYSQITWTWVDGGITATDNWYDIPV